MPRYYYDYYGRPRYAYQNSYYYGSRCAPRPVCFDDPPTYRQVYAGFPPRYSPGYGADQLATLEAQNTPIVYSSSTPSIHSYSTPSLEQNERSFHSESRRFYVTIPDTIAAGQSFQVQLDEQDYLIECPTGSRGGETIIVTVPIDKRHVSTIDSMAATNVLFDEGSNIELLQNMSIKAGIPQQRPIQWSDEVDLDDNSTTCFVCTFDNPMGSQKCQMCSSDLSHIGDSVKGTATVQTADRPSSNVWFDVLGVATAWIPFTAATSVEIEGASHDGAKPVGVASSNSV